MTGRAFIRSAIAFVAVLLALRSFFATSPISLSGGDPTLAPSATH